MANTRISNDDCYQEYRNFQYSGGFRYMMETPGPGYAPPMMDDAGVNAQGWGARTAANAIEIQNAELRGIPAQHLRRQGVNPTPTFQANPISPYWTSDALTSDDTQIGRAHV